ncbi:retrovirus-related pol polyprotein from transposon TNT 1-94 [Tanacetum coccineum]
MVTEDDAFSKEKEIDKLIDLISLSFKKIYKPTNNNLITSSNTSRANQDNTPRINKGTRYDNQRAFNVVEAKENVGTQVVHQSGIQCYNCKEYGHVAKEYQKSKRAKDAAYYKEKMLLCKQEEAGFQLNIQEVTPDVMALMDPSLMLTIAGKEEQGDTNITIDSLDMSTNGETVNQDDDDLAKERDLLASLIEKLKCEIDDSKNRNKFLETSNKALVDKFKGEIKDFKTKNKILESLNNHFKEANNKLSKTNQLMFKDLKKFQAELDRYHDVNYASKGEIDYAKAKDFSKSKSVTTNNVSNDFSKPVTAHILPQNVKSILKNTNVIASGMYNVHTNPNQTKTPQLPQDIRKTNKRVSFSTGVILTTSVSRPHLKTKRLEDRVMHNNSEGKKQEVEDHRRNFNFSNKKMYVTACNDSLTAKTSNVNFVCVTYGKCIFNDNHDMCFLHYINGVNSRTKMPMAVPISTREPKRTVNQSAATPLKRTVVAESTNQKPRSTIRKQYEHISKTCRWWYCKIIPPVYKWKPKSRTLNVEPNLVEIILFIVDSGWSKHMTGNLKLLSNFVEQFLGSVKFENDQIAPILGYRNLAQRKGNDLLTGSRGINLYSITLQDTSTPNPICLMAKASSSQAWLWHRHLSHLNFDTINLLSKYDIVTGLPKLKFVKDHLCSSYELGKAKRTEFLNKTLHLYFAQEGIEHQTSTARTPEQNDIVERRNCTLVEAARTMLSAAKVPLFFWAEAIATACFT